MEIQPKTADFILEVLFEAEELLSRLPLEHLPDYRGLEVDGSLHLATRKAREAFVSDLVWERRKHIA